MKRIEIIAIFFLIAVVGNRMIAQDVPTPAAVQTEAITLQGGRLHVGNGVVIEKSTIIFENGKISSVGNYSTNTKGKVIDVSGKDIYPGLIATSSELGLVEIEAVRATRDVNEVGLMNPNVRTAIAYNTDSRTTPTVRFNGVLSTQVTPNSGRISGTSSVMQMDAWNWEDALLKDDGVWIDFPNLFSYSGWWAEPGGFEKNKEYDNQLNELKSFLIESKTYCEKKDASPINLKYEAMRGVFSGALNLYIRANGIKEMKASIAMCEELNVKPVIVGADDAYMMADELAAKKIPVILNKCHALPSRSDDDIQQNYKTPTVLQKAGVLFCISISGSWQTRNLAFEAGTAAAFGLSKEEALAAITSNPAKILKLDNVLGTIETGKNATLLVCGGDIFDMRSSIIDYAFIEGRAISLGNKQLDLFHKFAGKYGIK
jgi:imidazolonepropionase-like amidohydrolase